MKRGLIIGILLLLICHPVRAEYWTVDTNRPAVCCDDRGGCQILQTVMMGSFAEFDPEDSLDVRVFSAVFLRLAAVMEEDFDHFSEYYNVDEQTIRRFYYIALSNCMWADIIITPLVEDIDEQRARIILLLFLESTEDEKSVELRTLIRENSTPDTLSVIAENAKVPIGFVEYLMQYE